MSIALQPVITQAGLSAVFAAQSDGLQARISHIALGEAGYTASTSQTSLQQERGRYPIATGERLSPQQIRVAALANDNLNYWVREVGVILDGGVLLAVWSSDQPVAHKSAGVELLLSFDLRLDALPPNSVNLVATPPPLALSLADELAQMATAIITTQRLVLRPFTT
ncbi:MAG: phage tail protein [Rhodocyclaceae bacterium]|nr:phage tail protein [Rhodocyclaceae bacterium]